MEHDSGVIYRIYVAPSPYLFSNRFFYPCRSSIFSFRFPFYFMLTLYTRNAKDEMSLFYRLAWFSTVLVCCSWSCFPESNDSLNSNTCSILCLCIFNLYILIFLFGRMRWSNKVIVVFGLYKTVLHSFVVALWIKYIPYILSESSSKN